MLAQFAKSKTIIFATLLAIIGAIQASSDVLAQFMTPQHYGLATMGIGVIVAVLRVVTTTSIGEK